MEPAALHMTVPADICSFKEEDLSSIHKFSLHSLTIDKTCQLNPEVKELPQDFLWYVIVSFDGKQKCLSDDWAIKVILVSLIQPRG